MRRIAIVFSAVLFNIFFISELNSKSLFDKYPTLMTQLKINMPAGADKNAVIGKLEKYFAGDIADLEKSFGMIMLENVYSAETGEKNYALYLFLFLLDNNCFIQDDGITLALALANNYLYSLVSADVRKEIESDIIKHYNFYIRVTEWQKTWIIKYRLSDAPALAKMIWCCRIHRAVNYEYIKDIPSYKKHIDSIESLEYMFEYIKLNSGIDKAESFQDIVKTLEETFLNEISVPIKCRSDKEKADLDSRINGLLDKNIITEADKAFLLQVLKYSTNDNVGLFKKTKKFFPYHCVTYTVLQIILYRSSGIPAHYVNSLGFFMTKNIPAEVFTGQIFSNAEIKEDKDLLNKYYKLSGKEYVLQADPGKDAGRLLFIFADAGYWKERDFTNHFFPMHYNIFHDKWDFVQADFMGRVESAGTAPAHANFFRIYWHHKILNAYSFGETVTELQLRTFYHRGISEEHLERILFYNSFVKGDVYELTKPANGLFSEIPEKSIYKESYCPDELLDDDRDRIPNFTERRLDLDPGNADTDNDGYSDNIELEFGFDPKDPKMPENNINIYIDGVFKDITDFFRMEFAEKKEAVRDDLEEYFKHKGLYAGIYNNKLYVASTFYGKAINVRNNFHIFVFKVRGGSRPGIYKLFIYPAGYNINFNNEDIHRKDINVSFANDAEILLPLDIFKDAEIIYIQHFTNAFKGEKIEYNAESSSPLKLIINGGDKDVLSKFPVNIKTVSDEMGLDGTKKQSEEDARVLLWKIYNSAWQEWMLIPFGQDNNYIIKSVYSDKVLTADENGFVYLTKRSDKSSQIWRIEKSGVTFYTIKNLNNNRYLDINNKVANGSFIITSVFSGLNTQLWIFW